MQRKWLFFLFISGFALVVTGQSAMVPVRYYATTEDYLSGRKSKDIVFLEIQTIRPDFIVAKDILDPKTKKGLREGRQAWAIEHAGGLYINLFHSQYSKANRFFVRQAIIGKVCLAVMEEDFVTAFSIASPNHGGGFSGVIQNESDMWGGGFTDSTGVKKKVFITNTKDLTPERMNAPIELLSSSKMKWLFGKKYSGKKSDYSVEEIRLRVEELNSLQ